MKDQPFAMLIGGRRITTEKSFPVVNPETEEVVAEAPEADAARVDQQVIPAPDGRFLHYTLRQPLGVVVGYLAWSFPLLNPGYKLGPVLASGKDCSRYNSEEYLTLKRVSILIEE